MKKNLIKNISLITFLFLFISIFSRCVFAASISTDKPDYSPGEIVRITGTGFLPYKLIWMTIVTPSGYVLNDVSRTNYLGTFVYRYGPDLFSGTYYVTATDFKNSASTTFTDVVPAYSVFIVQPANNTAVPNSVRVRGYWNVTNPPGQVSDYNVQILWGDGTKNDTVNINRTASTSGSNPPEIRGTFDTQPISGCTAADNATDDCNLGNFNHTYTGCGPFVITVKLYHAEPPGNEAGDSQATVNISIASCQPTTTTTTTSTTIPTTTTSTSSTTTSTTIPTTTTSSTTTSTTTPTTSTTIPTTTTISTTTTIVCNETWLENYTCVGDWLDRQWQRSSCYIVWENWKYCQYGCDVDHCRISLPNNSIQITYSDGGSYLKFSSYKLFNITYADNNVKITNNGSSIPIFLYVCGENFPGIVSFIPQIGTIFLGWKYLPVCDSLQPHYNGLRISYSLGLNKGVTLYIPKIYYTQPWSQGTLHFEYDTV